MGRTDPWDMVRKCSPAARPDKPIQAGIPAWMNARYALVSSYARTSDVISIPPDTGYVVPGDPERFALGFKVARDSANVVYFGPFDEIVRFGWRADNNTEWLWFDLFTYGAIVSAPWQVANAGSIPVRVIELVRQ